jgi:UV DNA damage repair endonuclease
VCAGWLPPAKIDALTLLPRLGRRCVALDGLDRPSHNEKEPVWVLVSETWHQSLFLQRDCHFLSPAQDDDCRDHIHRGGDQQWLAIATE